jgi:DNA-directed RNA polymerase sigma subunit (sigma70/sigma32)
MLKSQKENKKGKNKDIKLVKNIEKVKESKNIDKRNNKEEVDIFNEEEFNYEDTIVLEYKPTYKEEEDNVLSENEEIALFAGLSSVEEVLYDDVDYQEDLDNLHPAEIAARYQGTQKNPIGGSDEQILKDLRKLVFSVPLLHQEDVSKLFDQIDNCIFPTVFTIIESSMNSFEEVLQIVIKVAAGNTYGKNIYEKTEEHREEEENREIESRGTYKEHEIEFLNSAYEIFRLYAITSTPETKMKPPISIKAAMLRCNFIRGIYEDILSNFVTITENYERLHWNAFRAKWTNDLDAYHRFTNEIIYIDKTSKLNKSAFYISREAKRIYSKYMELRAMIITPYLRSVYSTAKNTARNSHQMLDNFQNGSIGLMRAVSCYSTKRMACFASVAKFWIKQMMLLSIKEDANFVKLPVSTWQAFTQLEKAKLKTGLNEDSINDIAKAAKMSLKKAKAVYYTVKIAQVYSLNRTYDADEKLTLEDIMTNEDRLGGYVDPFINLLRDYCDIAGLTELEMKVLALRHGMIDLIPSKPVNQYECLREVLVQNLASLGYNYKISV